MGSRKDWADLMLMPPIFAQPEDSFPTMVKWNAGV